MSRRFGFHAGLRWGFGLAAAAALILSAAPLEAQGPLNFHDRGGFPPGAPITPAGGGGPNAAFSEASTTGLEALPIETVLNAAGAPTALSGGEAALGTPVIRPETTAGLPAPTSEVSLGLVRTLTERNDGARAEAEALVEWIWAMTDSGLDVRGAVLAYNAFVDASSEEFLRSPPPLILSVRDYLNPLVQVAIESTD